MSKRRAAAIVLALAALLPAGRAAADQNWKTSSSVWKQMDKCNRAAQKAFPDFTREANSKREAYRQQCLRNANLPGEAAPPPPPPER
jgi:hypothetical protein